MRQLSLFLVFSALISGFSLRGQTAFEYYNIALVKYQMRDYKQAIVDLDRAIELNPDYTVAYNLRGASKFSIEDYEGAIEDYSQAIDIQRRRISRMSLTIYDRRGNVLDSHRPSDVDEGLAISYYNRAIVKLTIEDLEGAIEDYTLALEYDPALVQIYLHRGMLKQELDDMEGACSDFMQGEEHDVPGATEMLQEYCDQDQPDN